MMLTPPVNPLHEFNQNVRRMLSKSLIQAYRDAQNGSTEEHIDAVLFLASDDAQLWLQHLGVHADPLAPVINDVRLDKRNRIYRSRNT
jgi:hypothetical protein